MTLRSSLLSLLVVGLLGGRLAAALAPQTNADKVDTDLVTGELVLTGHAWFQWESALLIADQIRFNPKTNVAVARGHVSLTRGPRRLLADELTYNVQQHSFTLDNFRLGEYPIYLTGAHAQGDRSKITVNDALLSYTEPYFLGPSARAATLTYEPNKSVSAEHAHVGLGGSVPVSVPKFRQNFNDPILSYLHAHVGFRNSLGAELGLGARIPVSPGVQLGGDVGWYTKRGFLMGPSGSYDTKIAGQEMVGSFHSGYIHDYGDRLQDVLGDPIPKDRGYFEWTHHEDVTANLTVFGQLRYWSDSEIIRDFHPEEFFDLQTPDTFFEALYTGANYTVSLFTRYQPNTYVRTQERLPELRFDLMPTPIGWGIYERFSASAAVLRTREVAGRPALNSTRFDTFYGLSRPISPAPWLTLTPVAGGRLTYYGHALGARDDYTRVLGELGFDVNTLMSGVFAYQNARWEIDGIRHLVTPHLSYRYIPAADKGRPYIPDIDSQVFSTYLQPLELGDQRNIDELTRTNTLRLGVGNTFQTRDKHYGSRDLLIVNVDTDWRFQRQAGTRKFSDVQTEIAFMPARWLRLDVYQNIDPHDFSVDELNTGIQVVDSDVWSVRFGNRYLAHQIQEYLLDGKYRVNEAYQFFTRLHYDARETRFVERTVGLTQNLRNLWTIDYAVSFFSGRRRESNFGFALRINLVGF